MLFSVFSTDPVKLLLFAATSFVDLTAWRTFTPAAAECYQSLTMWTLNKYTCYPFVQFTELSEASGPARPQIGPVRWEMDSKLSGPASLLHLWRKGISVTTDRLPREFRWLIGTDTKAPRGKLLTQIKSPCSRVSLLGRQSNASSVALDF